MEHTTDRPLDFPPEKFKLENIENLPPTSRNITFTEVEKKKVVRKLDFYLLPLSFTLYTFSVLDRSNLGHAKLAGLSEDIDISGNRYTWLANIFYIAYIVFQFSNLGWKIFPPHKWVTFVVLFWGTVSTLQAVCTSWQGLMACRFFLGWAETMFGPGIPLYFSFFYPPEYLGVRPGIFLSGSALANAYGGTLAYGLSHVHSSVANWKFLFIIEARFFNEREELVAQAFAQTQPGDFEHEGLQISQLVEASKDYRNYFFALMNFSTNVSFASLPLFLPTIISELGTFSPLTSNGLSAPPYLLTFFLIIGTSIVSDGVRMRGSFGAFFALVSAIGYIILRTSTSVAARYVGIFLAVTIFTTTNMILIWNSNANATGSKRAGGLWITMAVGQCGTLLGTNSFPPSEGPYYRRGMWTACAFALLASAACATLSLLLFLENRERDRKYGKVEVIGRLDASTSQARETDLRYII